MKSNQTSERAAADKIIATLDSMILESVRHSIKDIYACIHDIDQSIMNIEDKMKQKRKRKIK